jgi:hypothetical protein
MNHAFDVNLAKDFSVYIALFLGHLDHWTFKNLANKKNIHDGLCWTYDTLEAMGDIFPYFSRRQRERIINTAVKEGLVIRGNYNKNKYDRTVWYALTPKAYHYFPHLNKDKYLETLYLSISPNGEMDFTEWRNQFHRSVTPIPDTNPDTNPDKKLTNCSSSSFIFSETTDKNILNQKLTIDSRTDNEFMEDVVKHIDECSEKSYPRLQRAGAAVKLLKKLKSENIVFMVGGKNDSGDKYSPKKTEVQKTSDLLMYDYKLYFSQFLNDRDYLKIPSVQGKEPLSFKAWSAKNANQTRMPA